jgi:hypothetical protein
MGSADRDAGFGLATLALGALLVLASGAMVRAQVVLHPDSLESGKTTPDVLERAIQEGAEAQKARGNTAARYGAYTVGWPNDVAERDALAGYTVVMTTVLTQTQAELPLQRVYLVTPDGRETNLRALGSWSGKVNPKTLAYTELGKFRQDGFYIISGTALRRQGEVRLDFAINRVGFALIHLPLTAQDLGYELKDPPPNGAQPDSATLRTMIQREFPGFPVPKL